MITGRYDVTSASTRGHGVRLQVVVGWLNSKGAPGGLRPTELHKLVWDGCIHFGFSTGLCEWPSRSAIDRWVRWVPAL
jgi:hypothetical protein